MGIPTTFTSAEQAAFLHQTRVRERDNVLFDLAFATGARQHELLALNVEDLLGDDGVKAMIQLKVTKGGRPRALPLPDRIRRKLGAFIARRISGPLFVSRNGDRLAASTLRELMRTYVRLSGIRPHHFHELRHTAGTEICRVAGPVAVQRILGHVDIATTMIYVHPSDQELLDAVNDNDEVRRRLVRRR